MKKKILIIEDYNNIVEILTMRLSAMGYAVISAKDGQEGLTLARKEKPDLIVLDVTLPKMNGYKISRLLKFDSRYKDIPIIILTGKTQLINRYWSLISGADAYFLKPQGMEELSQRVQEIVDFLAKYKKRENSSSPPTTIKDTLSYVLDMLYNQLFIYTLKFEFTQQVENI
ncbi:response regulator, partial [candidate division KSB1 bacterium]|nr:response regulator [candidate division KSB1 bacterium]